VKSAPAKSEAKAALPKTGDSSASTVAAVAAMGAAIAALGLSLRRKGQRN
jgi:LPXTG-motif cell wall-anchored protein